KVTSTASRTASVRTRLSAALGAVVVVAGAVIILAVQGVSALQTRQAQASQHALPYVSGLSDAALAAKAAATDERGFLMTGQASFRTEAVGRRTVEQAGLAQAKATAVGTDQAAAVDRISTGLDAFNQALDQEFDLYASNHQRAVTVALGAN